MLSLAHPESTSQMASQSLQSFLHYIYGREFLHSKLALCMEKYGPPSNSSFVGPTTVHNSNGILIHSAIFAGFMIMADQPTDNQTSCSVCNKSSAVAEMGNRGHNRHGSKRGGCCAPFAERFAFFCIRIKSRIESAV